MTTGVSSSDFSITSMKGLDDLAFHQFIKEDLVMLDPRIPQPDAPITPSVAPTHFNFINDSPPDDPQPVVTKPVSPSNGCSVANPTSGEYRSGSAFERFKEFEQWVFGPGDVLDIGLERDRLRALSPVLDVPDKFEIQIATCSADFWKLLTRDDACDDNPSAVDRPSKEKADPKNAEMYQKFPPTPPYGEVFGASSNALPSPIAGSDTQLTPTTSTPKVSSPDVNMSEANPEYDDIFDNFEYIKDLEEKEKAAAALAENDDESVEPQNMEISESSSTTPTKAAEFHFDHLKWTQF